jgi:hypothetical protein
MGETCAVCQSVGTTPVSKDLLKMSKNMANSVQTDVLIMDFSKAFDKVSHNLLTHKLNYYGIQGKTNTWIHNFLSNRTQTVLLEGETSDYGHDCANYNMFQDFTTYTSKRFGSIVFRRIFKTLSCKWVKHVQCANQ